MKGAWPSWASESPKKLLRTDGIAFCPRFLMLDSETKQITGCYSPVTGDQDILDDFAKLTTYLVYLWLKHIFFDSHQNNNVYRYSILVNHHTDASVIWHRDAAQALDIWLWRNKSIHMAVQCSLLFSAVVIVTQSSVRSVTWLPHWWLMAGNSRLTQIIP